MPDNTNNSGFQLPAVKVPFEADVTRMTEQVNAALDAFKKSVKDTFDEVDRRIEQAKRGADGLKIETQQGEGAQDNSFSRTRTVEFLERYIRQINDNIAEILRIVQTNGT